MPRKTREEWIELFKLYELDKFSWDEYFESINRYKEFPTRKRKSRNHWKLSARSRFFYKYKNWKMMDNLFIVKK